MLTLNNFQHKQLVSVYINYKGKKLHRYSLNQEKATECIKNYLSKKLDISKISLVQIDVTNLFSSKVTFFKIYHNATAYDYVQYLGNLVIHSTMKAEPDQA